MARKKSAKAGKKRTRKARIVAPVGKQRRAEIREYSKFVPSLSKLKGKKGLTASELGQLTRAKKALRHTDNLHPVTEKQFAQLKKQGLIDPTLSKKGVHAVRLRNTSPDAKIKVLKSGIMVSSNGRTWEYHPVSADVDTLAEYGIELLQRKDVQQINLWLAKGRANEGFRTEESWTAYLYNRFQQYVNQQDYTNGIAALIKEQRKKRA